MIGFIGGLTAGLICAAAGVWATWLAGKSARRKTVESAEAQLAKARKELSEAREEIARRKAANSKRNAAAETTDPQLTAAQKQLADSQQTITKLEDQLRQTSDEANAAKAELSELQKQAADAQTTNARVEADAQKTAQLEANANLKIAQLESDLKQQITATELAQSQLTALQSELADTREKLSEAESEAQRRLSRLEADARQCMTVAETAEGRLKETEKELASAEARIAQLEAEAAEAAVRLDVANSATPAANATATNPGSPDAQLAAVQKQLAEAQQRISQLEADAEMNAAQLDEERKRWQALEGFAPRIVMAGAPPNNQFITVTDSAEFRVAEMDYVTADGSRIAGQTVDRSGRSVQIPIDETKVSEVQNQGCNPHDGSFSMSFRVHVEVNGMTKAFLLPVTVAVNSAKKLEPMPLGIAMKDKNEQSA